jgi:hypothetical protein
MVGAAIGTAAQVGASIYGAIKSSQANKKAMDILKAQKDENKKWYEERMGEDYLQRADVQNVLRKQRELLGEQYKRARATNVVAGGTDESLAMQQQAANEIMGDTMGNIAAQAESYKEGVENQYRTTDAALSQQEMGIHQAQAQTIANAAGQVSKAANGLVTGGMDKQSPSTEMPSITPNVDVVANEALAEATANENAAWAEAQAADKAAIEKYTA